MTAVPAPLPGLALPAEDLAAGLRVVVCQDCHRPLKGRLARMRRRGDACAHKHGERSAPGVGRFQVEQEGLFGG